MFNHENIRNYAELMKELDLSALEITEGDRKLRLERTVAQPVQTIAVPAQTQIPVQQTSAVTASAPQTSGKAIISPMVGVFYRAPAENAEPFVKVGDTVREGDTVGIIEAMKLMNEVISDTDGVVEEICAENAQTVDYGCVLMRIRAN